MHELQEQHDLLCKRAIAQWRAQQQVCDGKCRVHQSLPIYLSLARLPMSTAPWQLYASQHRCVEPVFTGPNRCVHAGALAVEVMAAALQHPQGARAPAPMPIQGRIADGHAGTPCPTDGLLSSQHSFNSGCCTSRNPAS